MGVLSDLVTGTDADIERIGAALVPSKEFGGIDIKGIDTIRFATLQSILTGLDFKALFKEYDPVFSASDDGPWVFRIPQTLVLRLAELSVEERASAAHQWAATEEFAGADEKDVSSVLDAIVNLATRAVASKESVFLWMSL